MHTSWLWLISAPPPPFWLIPITMILVNGLGTNFLVKIVQAEVKQLRCYSFSAQRQEGLQMTMDWVTILTQVLKGSVQTSKLLPPLWSINLCWMCFFSPEIFLYFFTCQVGPWKPVCVCFVFYCVWKSLHTFQIWLETSPQAHRYTEYVICSLKFSVGGSERVMLKLKWCST